MTREMREQAQAELMSREPQAYDYAAIERSLADLPLTDPEEARRKLAELRNA